MNKQRCKFCHNFQYIVFEDYERKVGSIKGCYDCFENESEGKIFASKYPELLKEILAERFKMIDCKCGNRFLPRFDWVKVCPSCYRKKKQDKQVKEVLCL